MFGKCRRPEWATSTNIRCLIVILTPLFLLPMPLAVPTPEMKTAFAVLLMAIYWMTEALPLGITALIPTFLFPLLGVVKSKDVSQCYMKESIMLFVGGFFVAAAFEKHNLHKRIALKVLLVIGTSMPRLLAGVMTVTAFLSMWMSNTATATMMIPIVEAVLQQLKCHLVEEDQNTEEQDDEEEGAIHVINGKTNTDIPLRESPGKDHQQVARVESAASQVAVLRRSPSEEGGQMSVLEFSNICKVMSLSVAYGATCGGSATLTGNGVIVTAKEFVDNYFYERGKLESGMTFTTWMMFSFPVTLIGLGLSWLWLQLLWIGVRKTFRALTCGNKGSKAAERVVYNILKSEYSKLGPTSFAEKGIMVHFVTLALLWFFRDPGMFPGWASLFEKGYVGAMVPATFIGTLIFVFPATNPFKKGWKYEPIMDMKTLTEKMPIGIIFLLGGGMALALACETSGLSTWLGSQMTALSAIPTWILLGIVCLMLSLFTEFMSNIAVISIVMPILAELAVAINVNPMRLIMPGTIAVTFAFMLPVATPPNAIVFSYGHLKIMDMVKSGLVMNLICIVIVTIAGNTWGMAVFNYGELPKEWLQTTVDPGLVNATAGYLLL